MSVTSSFKKKESAVLPGNDTKAQLDGVKAWTIGSSMGLISSGHAQLDKLLGGGLALGTVCLQEIDNYSDYGKTFTNYNIAESISAGHITVIILSSATDAEEFLKKLPLNQSKDSSTKDSRSTFCFSYDLSKSLQPKIISAATIDWIFLDTFSEENKMLDEIFHRISSIIDAAVSSNVVRVFFPHFDHLALSLPKNETLKVAQFILRIKHKIRSTRAFFHFAVSAGLLLSCPFLSTKLCAIADTVLAIQSFAGRRHSLPYEFEEFNGFLMILKIQENGVFASFRPSSARFGLKRDRRKLHIEPLHLPPEQSRAFAGVGGFDSHSHSQSSQVGQSPSSSSGVEIHYHPPSLQVDLKASQPSSKALVENRIANNSNNNKDGSDSDSGINSSAKDDSGQKKVLSSSIAALKAARASQSGLILPSSLAIPAPVSIAARPKHSHSQNSTIDF